MKDYGYDDCDFELNKESLLHKIGYLYIFGDRGDMFEAGESNRVDYIRQSRTI